MPENDYFLPLPPTHAAERKSGRTNVISPLKRRGRRCKKARSLERERENFSFSRSVSPGLYYFFPFFARKERRGKGEEEDEKARRDSNRFRRKEKKKKGGKGKGYLFVVFFWGTNTSVLQFLILPPEENLKRASSSIYRLISLILLS